MAVQNLGRVTGYSAYEIAVQNGYVGTEAEWVASLKGDRGATGPQGPQGPTGPQGATGATGAQGPAGADGADGASAGFGTPTISVSGLAGGQSPTASIGVSGPDTAKVFEFNFGIPAGTDGYTPTANVVKTGSVATITITDAEGTTTASIYDGSVGTLSAGANIDITNDTISVPSVEFEEEHDEEDPYSVFKMNDTDGFKAESYEWDDRGEEYNMTFATSIGAGGIEVTDSGNDVSIYYGPGAIEFNDNGNNEYHELTVDSGDLCWDGGAIALVGDIPSVETFTAGTGIVLTSSNGETTIAVDTTTNGVAMKSDLPRPDGTTITASNGVWSAVGGGGGSSYENWTDDCYTTSEISANGLSGWLTELNTNNHIYAYIMDEPGTGYDTLYHYIGSNNDTQAGIESYYYTVNLTGGGESSIYINVLNNTINSVIRGNYTYAQLPVYTVSDAGKVLTVSANGMDIEWDTSTFTFTESDPVFSASPAATITASDISAWNGIVGVPTYSAADDGKALVVTSSGSAIGWDTVGGGSGEYVLTLSTQFISTNDLTNDDKAALLDLYNNPTTAKRVDIYATPYKQWFYYSGNYDNKMVFWAPMDHQLMTVQITNNGQAVGTSSYINTPWNMGEDPINAGKILLSGTRNPNPASTASITLYDGMQWIHNNFPTPDGTTITASGNVWSAVGGGGGLPTASSADDGKFLMWDDRGDEAVWADQAAPSSLVTEQTHSSQADYQEASVTYDGLSAYHNVYNYTIEDYIREHSAEITSTDIYVARQEYDDSLQNTYEASGASLSSSEVSVYSNAVGYDEENQVYDVYEEYRTTISPEGLVFGNCDGVGGNENQAVLYLDGSTLKVDINGDVYTVSLIPAR